jgi:hypothetical protein
VLAATVIALSTTALAAASPTATTTTVPATSRRAWAAGGQRLQVLMPADLSDTLDLLVDPAKRFGGTPHDGNLLHVVLVYDLHCNGVRVVRRQQG